MTGGGPLRRAAAGPSVLGVVVAGAVVAALLAAAAVAMGDGGTSDARDRRGDGRPAGEPAGAAALPGTVDRRATVERRGSFAVPCELSHSAPDDPIVHPGHHGRSHRHDFFGATTTGASSTAATLLAGDTTCRSVADHSAYWVPALLAGGRPVPPTHAIAYYRTPVGADAAAVVPPPNGLEMIAGDATARRPQHPSVVRWACDSRETGAATPRRCPGGAELRVHLTFPQCWDGEHLRSRDHRSHLAQLPGSDEERSVAGAACPASHPVLIPEVTLEVRYRDVPAGALELASGPVTGGHGDVLVAWEREHFGSEIETCLRRNLSCDVVSEPGRLDVP